MANEGSAPARQPQYIPLPYQLFVESEIWFWEEQARLLARKLYPESPEEMPSAWLLEQLFGNEIEFSPKGDGDWCEWLYIPPARNLGRFFALEEAFFRKLLGPAGDPTERKPHPFAALTGHALALYGDIDSYLREGGWRGKFLSFLMTEESGYFRRTKLRTEALREAERRGVLGHLAPIIDALATTATAAVESLMKTYEAAERGEIPRHQVCAPPEFYDSTCDLVDKLDAYEFAVTGLPGFIASEEVQARQSPDARAPAPKNSRGVWAHDGPPPANLKLKDLGFDCTLEELGHRLGRQPKWIRLHGGPKAQPGQRKLWVWGKTAMQFRAYLPSDGEVELAIKRGPPPNKGAQRPVTARNGKTSGKTASKTAVRS